MVLLLRKWVEVEVVMLVYSVGGDFGVVGLLDIYRFIENEMCMDFLLRIVEMIFVLEWFY